MLALPIAAQYPPPRAPCSSARIRSPGACQRHRRIIRNKLLRHRDKMDFDTYARSKHADYAALAETVATVLRAAIAAYPETFRLQQVQQRSKSTDSLRKKLEDRGILATASLEDDIKDLAGCRLIFY